MTLTFDSVGAWNYLVTCLVEASDGIMKWFVGEVSGAGSGSGLSGKGKADMDQGAAELIGGMMIVQQVAFYADAIAESYGIGSGADTGDFSFWNEYKSSFKWFNRARTGMTIVGRPLGSYKDMWGNAHKSLGLFEGKNLEGITFFDKELGREVTIEPVYANFAIQNAEKRFLQHEGRVKRELDMAIDKWVSGLGRFFIER